MRLDRLRAEPQRLANALDERAAAEVERLLREEDVAITSVNLFEVVDFLIRRAGWPEEEVRAQLSLLLREVVRVRPFTEDKAWRGAALRARYYAKRRYELSLADCALLAGASGETEIATSDPAIAAAARAEGIGVVASPDTRVALPDQRSGPPRAARAAQWPHMPCTPPPGGVDDEQR